MIAVFTGFQNELFEIAKQLFQRRSSKLCTIVQVYVLLVCYEAVTERGKLITQFSAVVDHADI